MQVLIQRVSQAQVAVDTEIVSKIGCGLLVFIGFEKNDGQAQVGTMIKRLLSYRVFNDSKGKMNLSVKDVEGALLLVPQFTLAADTASGTRAGFSTAKEPVAAETLYNDFVEQMQTLYQSVATGVFAADMQVALVNDGPVTFMLSC